jgi:Zn-dependent protease with chaperone function
MQMFQHDSVLITTLVALVPAAVSWLSGRRLARHEHDPSLPERLLAHQRRSGIALGVAGAMIAVDATRSIPWAAPLLFTSLLLAGYRLRRTLFDETWTVARYLSFFHRLTIAVFGFWIVLASVPLMAAQAGTRDWMVGGLLAAALIGWERYYAPIFRWLIGATALEDGPILERCRALANAAGMPGPAYLRVDLHGGSVVNALALPSLRGNAVLFTDTLLARLDAGEIAAICAHELAHFEHFDAARLRRMRIATLTLIAGAALVAPVARLTDVAGAGLASVIWFATFATALAIRAKGKQRQETICDQRAVALVGDGELLVSALTKIYTLARMPRRLETRQEQASSHPSLSRRIRDIRKAAGTPPVPLTAPVTIPSSDGRSSVTFEPSALHWAEQAGMNHVLSYPHLVELRLEPHGRRGPRLRAVMPGARTWEMPVAAADVARLQDVLDRVDGQLGDAPAPRGLPINLGRLFVLLASVTALTLGQIAVAVVALLAWLVPATPLLAATGVAALAAVALGLRDHSAPAMLGLAMLAPAGALMMWLAWQARHDQHRNPRTPVALLAVIAVPMLLSLGRNGLDPVSLHLTARAAPAATVLCLALAGALAFAPRRRRQLSGLSAVALAMVAATLGSQPFLDTFGRDPFLVSSPPIRWTLVDAATARDFEIPETTSAIELAPAGLHIAARQYTDSAEEVSTFEVGMAGRPLAPLQGDMLRFVDDNTVLIASAEEQGTLLRQVRIGTPHQESWRQRVPGLHHASLSVGRRDGRWRLNGYDRDDGIVRAEGSVGTAEVRERRWASRYTRDALIDAVSTDGRDPLVVETSYDGGVLDRLPGHGRLLGMLLDSGTQHSRYWSIGDDGVIALGASRLGASCTGGLEGGALACSVFDGTRTRLLRLGADGTVTGIGWFDGRLAWHGDLTDGWMTGWIGATAVAIDLANRHMLSLPRSEGTATQLTVSGRRLAAVVFTAGVYRLRIYEIAPDGSTEEGALARAGNPRR